MYAWAYKTHLGEFIESLKNEGKSIGFVPTMGALHQGHLALVKRSLAENDHTVVSIFVNPTQFDRKEDLNNYPRFPERDLALLETLDKNIIVYLPEPNDLYGGKVQARKYDLDGLDLTMEGKFRPGHFDGVATVVELLFDAVKPDRAYFGEKDFQQLRIIQTLVQKLNIPVRIIPVEIQREADGLAISSRNLRLTEKYRKEAPIIYRLLLNAQEMAQKGFTPNEIRKTITAQFKHHPLLRLEYFEIADEQTLRPAQKFEPGKKYRAFVAVFAGNVRLIDNISLNPQNRSL